MKYNPQTKSELEALVRDERVYLGEIDTSAITDMSMLFAISSVKSSARTFLALLAGIPQVCAI